MCLPEGSAWVMSTFLRLPNVTCLMPELHHETYSRSHWISFWILWQPVVLRDTQGFGRTLVSRHDNRSEGIAKQVWFLEWLLRHLSCEQPNIRTLHSPFWAPFVTDLSICPRHSTLLARLIFIRCFGWSQQIRWRCRARRCLLYLFQRRIPVIEVSVLNDHDRAYQALTHTWILSISGFPVICSSTVYPVRRDLFYLVGKIAHDSV